MKLKLLLSLTLVLSGSYIAFALVWFIQLKPAEMDQHQDILIRSSLDARVRNFCVVLLPQKDSPISMLQGSLKIYDGTNHLVSCSVDGITLSDVSAKSWGNMYKIEIYRAMTNQFSRPLNGARVFTFHVATNLLASSQFSIGESGEGSSYDRWFYLKDFSNEK